MWANLMLLFTNWKLAIMIWPMNCGFLFLVTRNDDFCLPAENGEVMKGHTNKDDVGETNRFVSITST